jgi:hypothetical protein
VFVIVADERDVDVGVGCDGRQLKKSKGEGEREDVLFKESLIQEVVSDRHEVPNQDHETKEDIVVLEFLRRRQ